jgi:hypothetical protein
MSARSNTGARASKGTRSKWLAESPAELTFDQAPGDDKKILECLGAGVIMRWGTLPTKIQRELFEHATSLADLAQTAPPKGQIARLLHNHKMTALGRQAAQERDRNHDAEFFKSKPVL